MRFNVQVTERHIRCGTQGECNECPIALALREIFPGIEVMVFGHTVRIGKKCYDLPRVCEKFAEAFDNGRGEVGPFSFVLDTSREKAGWKWS